ncbi:protein Abitram [Aplysia californica]|uniref:Protein Abitram n=1 Tax=Aplysia californica TaxID=6500 RepID=A0ABM0JYM5_APLCA|nr:protein Abitram [Aplysia californica]
MAETQQSTNLEKPPPGVVERYFKKHFRIDLKGKKYEDQVVLTHSNRVCVVCIAESHPICSEKKEVIKVDFEVKGSNRMDNKMSGKAKRGAQWLGPTAVLCEVTCSDESKYTLYCCVKGQLVEVNENLITKPCLLTEKPLGAGYLAVMLPGLKHFDKEIAQLMCEEKYKKALEERSTNVS